MVSFLAFQVVVAIFVVLVVVDVVFAVIKLSDVANVVSPLLIVFAVMFTFVAAKILAVQRRTII